MGAGGGKETKTVKDETPLHSNHHETLTLDDEEELPSTQDLWDLSLRRLALAIKTVERAQHLFSLVTLGIDNVHPRALDSDHFREPRSKDFCRDLGRSFDADCTLVCELWLGCELRRRRERDRGRQRGEEKRREEKRREEKRREEKRREEKSRGEKSRGEDSRGEERTVEERRGQ